ncbi:MAG: hypothetical protein J6N20_00265 [Pseudomonas sp.]|nr:hypothetical protein [Pseudomonas sp.]
MSKNNQRNQSEINLGNETYNRGYLDGLAGNPKTIKKTHRHAHRYHIGYRHGQDETKRTTGAPLILTNNNVAHVHHKIPAGNPFVPKSFWQRFCRWIKS